MDYNDFGIKPVVLPMEQQVSEPLNVVLERIIREGMGEKPRYKSPALTTDVYGRGYPPSQAELESVRLMNEKELEILNKDPNIVLSETGSLYYLCEDGVVFKTTRNGLIYRFSFDTFEWIFAPELLEIVIGSRPVRTSKLQNFRDYYKAKPLEHEILMPRDRSKRD